MKIGNIVNVSFENYTSGNFWNNFEINFKAILKNNDLINKILECIGQGQFIFEHLLSTYETVDSRNGIIFMAKGCRTGKLEKIIIDATYGGLCVNQIKELTYMVGRDCDKRIILYTQDRLNDKEKECKHLVHLKSGKTLCRIYKDRIGKEIGEIDGNKFYCVQRELQIKLMKEKAFIEGCPYNEQS